jgi:hypothetical protein
MEARAASRGGKQRPRANRTIEVWQIALPCDETACWRRIEPRNLVDGYTREAPRCPRANRALAMTRFASSPPGNERCSQCDLRRESGPERISRARGPAAA